MKKRKFNVVFAEAMATAGLSFRSLGKTLGVSHTHLCNVANGKKSMSSSLLRKIEHDKIFEEHTMGLVKEAWWQEQ